MKEFVCVRGCVLALVIAGLKQNVNLHATEGFSDVLNHGNDRYKNL